MVGVRCRPLNKKEVGNSEKSSLEFNSNRIAITHPDPSMLKAGADPALIFYTTNQPAW